MTLAFIKPLKYHKTLKIINPCISALLCSLKINPISFKNFFFVMFLHKQMPPLISQKGHHCVKSVQVRIFFLSVFPAFGLNRKVYSLNIRIQSKCGKIRTRRKPVFRHFSRSAPSRILISF